MFFSKEKKTICMFLGSYIYKSRGSFASGLRDKEMFASQNKFWPKEFEIS